MVTHEGRAKIDNPRSARGQVAIFDEGWQSGESGFGMHRLRALGWPIVATFVLAATKVANLFCERNILFLTKY